MAPVPPPPSGAPTLIPCDVSARVWRDGFGIAVAAVSIVASVACAALNWVYQLDRTSARKLRDERWKRRMDRVHVANFVALLGMSIGFFVDYVDKQSVSASCETTHAALAMLPTAIGLFLFSYVVYAVKLRAGPLCERTAEDEGSSTQPAFAQPSAAYRPIAPAPPPPQAPPPVTTQARPASSQPSAPAAAHTAFVRTQKPGGRGGPGPGGYARPPNVKA